MARFSETYGYARPSVLSVQVESLDNDTRRRIWNVMQPLPNEILRGSFGESTRAPELVDSHLWTEFFKEALPVPRGRDRGVWARVESSVFDDDFYEVLDLIEVIAEGISRFGGIHAGRLDVGFTESVNAVFERALVEYRVVNGAIVRIGSTVDAEAVSYAATSATVIESSREHIQRAIEALAERDAPDYITVIRESILAAESIACRLTGKKTLGAAINQLAGSFPDLHPAVLNGWRSLYGWASDDSGIRHGGAVVAAPSFALARWVLVSSSAFVTYLAEDGYKVASDGR